MRNKIKVALIIIFFLILAAGGLVMASGLKEVKVKGNIYYTDDKLKDELKKYYVKGNTILTYLRLKYDKSITIPFVDEIDVVIPVPETSNDIAVRIANVLYKPYRQGFVKNRYVARTFIMPGQAQRKSSVRRKLNAIAAEFKGKNVLLVDDSIVRGTTSEQIVEMARAAGAKKVYFASAAPEIRYPNVYGIDMPTSEELVAYHRDVDQIAEMIGVDKLIFQDLSSLFKAVQLENPTIKNFDASVFTGEYITGDVNKAYLDAIANARNDKAKAKNAAQSGNLEIHNISASA